jgi:glycosyltransferase involved in cell wall biosynthesis
VDSKKRREKGVGTPLKDITMSKPALSIGFPVYNGERYLHQSLGSLLSQDFEDFELIISDNGSTDQTEAICRDLAQKDRRIRYLRSDENRGATWNFRKVFEVAQGDFFKYAAYDDECYPTMLRRCMEVIAGNDPTVALVYTQSEIIDESSAVIERAGGPKWDRVATTARTPHERLVHVLWWVLYGHAHYGVIRASFLRRARPYGHLAPDWVNLAELAMMGKIVEVPEVLFRLRRHSANLWSPSNRHTPLQIRNWHNPAESEVKKVLPFRIAVISEYLKSIRHLPLSRFERIKCMSVACLTPPLRSIWIWLLRVSGPTRKYLRELTGFRALYPSAGAR